ncbi:MAG: Gfo/Idh/MocA family oxidoreductase [Prolixibacteraceae bacterium]|nr:Gfo/Idh/MocA family oxidoreductase [Prolixibacteraceae bacterium]
MKKQNFSISRRKFIYTASTAAIAAPFILDSCKPSGKLRHACIGTGGMGWGDLHKFIDHPNVEITAICDVDEARLKKASGVVPGARTYRDWRELLEKEAANIDSVNVTVPDHNHFPIAWQAIKNGKHVYCQKPMCHDVAEVRLLTEASVEKGVITQLGTQHASSANDRRAVKLLKQGAVGKVQHVYLCSNRPGAIENYRLEGPRPQQGEEVPSELDWDLWIGTAPMRPFVPKIYHPVLWRGWLDFGTGWSGDIGCHLFDAVWKGLSLSAPKSVIAEVQKSWLESPARRADNWPQSNHITWTFPGNKLTDADELPVEWFDGEFFPPAEIQELFPGEQYPPESAMIVGTEGALLVVHGGDLVLLPQSKFKNHRIPDFKDRNHYHHFVDACLGGKKTESHFAQSGPMTEAILLGTVAIRVPGQLLEWDPVNLKIPNYPAAEQYLSRNYREGWNIAGF